MFTKNCKFLKLNPFVFSKWYCSLPGVATTTCGFFAKATACVISSIPPTTVTHRTPIALPKASNCSVIWYASSLVGAITHANNPRGSSHNFCRIGSANAAVLPEPVEATPMMSLPSSAWGSAAV